MPNFKHYILTRFNRGIYNFYKKKIKVPADQWMRHRIDLFKAITLPSIQAQTCQNFTWLLLLDPKTPQYFLDEMYAIDYPNIKILDVQQEGDYWLTNFEECDGDYITTRIDNDDAFDIHAIEAIQTSYENDQSFRVIIFPYGYIFELATRKIYMMKYWGNNCPTLIQSSTGRSSIFDWDHSQIHYTKEIPKEYCSDRSYWLQVVHSNNLINSVKASETKEIRFDLPMNINTLSAFNIDPNTLPKS